MVPEELPEGAAGSAPAAEGEPEQSAPVVEHPLPGTGGSAARIKWADASEEATPPEADIPAGDPPPDLIDFGEPAASEQPDWVGDESEQVVESSEAAEVPPVSSEASVPAEPKASVGTTSDSCPIYVQYLAVDPDDEPQPPPTSPNLVQEEAAVSASEGSVVRTGHSPATGSRPPRERGSRGSRGGWNRQQRAAIKNWQTDLTHVRDWLYRETGGDQGGFWLRWINYERADPEFIWFVAVFKVLLRYCWTDQILVLLSITYRPYSDWSSTYGLRAHEGCGRGRDILQSTSLPD
eukprot:s1727_g25.t1